MLRAAACCLALCACADMPPAPTAQASQRDACGVRGERSASGMAAARGEGVWGPAGPGRKRRVATLAQWERGAYQRMRRALDSTQQHATQHHTSGAVITQHETGVPVIDLTGDG